MMRKAAVGQGMAGSRTTRRGWGVLALLALLVLLATGCRRDPGGQLPEVGGEKLQAKREQVEGFALVRAWPDQADGQLALALEFSQPLVGTQDFDALLRVEPAGAEGSGWSLATTASPPSSVSASRASPACRRSAKKPTLQIAATASATATSISRNSPARKSRSSCRQARCSTEGGLFGAEGWAAAWVFMPPRYTAPVPAECCVQRHRMAEAERCASMRAPCKHTPCLRSTCRTARR
mgnify:CR=1 FL=1